MPEKNGIEIILDYKEWQVFECKRARVEPAKILEAIVAFANAEGGTLVLGIDDPDKTPREKRLIGISECPDNTSEIINLIPKSIVFKTIFS